MAAPPASDETVTGADGNLSAGATGQFQQGDIENALPVMNLSWRAHFRRHQERFGELDPAVRAGVVRVWVIRACFVLLALAALPVLLVHFSGQQMAQAWVMAVALCFYVFLFLFLLVRWRWCYADLFRLSYGLLLAYLAAGVIGPRTTVFVMHLSTVWAAMYLGYSLAVNRLRHGTERAIDALPPPSWVTIGLVVSVLWTALMAAIVYGLNVTDANADALVIVFSLSLYGWIHAAVWVLAVSCGCMDGVLLNGEPVRTLLALLLPCMMFSPVIGLLSLVSAVLTTLFYWLLLMAVVAFLGYILTVYRHYQQTVTAAPSTPAIVIEETTLQCEIQQDSLGQVKSCT